MVYQLRLLLAEKLIYWSLIVAPKGDFKFYLANFLAKELIRESGIKDE